MSLHFIIDGCNVIHNPHFSRVYSAKSSDQRVQFINFLKSKRPCGSRKNKITVVFDGFPRLEAQYDADEEIEIIFSRRENADARIKKILERQTQPKTAVVVSDDRDIQFFTRSARAKVMPVEDFLIPHRKSQGRVDDIPKAELTYSQVHEINKELSKRWLH